MTAAMNDVDEETLKSLHVMCVTEVRKSMESLITKMLWSIKENRS